MKKNLFLFLAISLLILSIGAAGCANDEGDAPGGQKSSGLKLIAVGEATFAPFEFIDPDTEKLVGFDVDLIAAIAEKAGFEVEYRNMAWNSLVAALQNKEADLIVSGMTINDERLLTVAFSDPYFASGQAWGTIDGSDIKTLNDLAGKTVAVQINTTGDFAAQGLNSKFEDEGLEPINIKRLANAADVFNELKAGGCDAVVSDLPVIQEYMKNNPGEKVVVPEPAFTVEYYGIAMRKDDKEIHNLINKGLAKTKAEGTYDEIYEKYFGAE